MGIRTKLILLASVLLNIHSAYAASFSDWQFRQQFDLPQPGLIKFTLPLDTLDAARADLADVRVSDGAGNELPYLIDTPEPAGRIVRPVKSFRVELDQNSTVITLETGLSQPLDRVRLFTPSANFIKAVSVAGSSDGKNWQPLVTGQPIFQQPNGASQLRLELAPRNWAFLRLTVDDRASAPVAFTGAEVEAAVAEPAPTEPVAVQITDRQDNAGETRLVLNLGAAHLHLASLEIESPDLLFRRQITLATRDIEENTVKEKILATGSIHRVTVAGLPASAKLSIPLNLQTTSRELLLIIHNGDSPPLQVTGAHFQRRPVYLLFLAPNASRYDLFSGNLRSAAPRYDLANQPIDVKNTPLASIRVTALMPNPAYKPPEALPSVSGTGAALDVSNWRFRKTVKSPSSGVQELELDLEVLSHAQPGLADLRLGQNGKQIPFVIERTSTIRLLKPQSARADDPHQPKLSRWVLKAPQADLPFAKLACASQTALFRREVNLHEEPADSRGTKYRHELGNATWSHSPDRANQTLFLAFQDRPRTDTFFLEVNNEDNPAIDLTDFQLGWPATRLLFKTSASDNLFLFYGNPDVSSPRYDLSIVANQLLIADKALATLGPEERLKNPSWSERQKPGQGGWLLWGALGLVVVVLLLVITRMIPRTSSS